MVYTNNTGATVLIPSDFKIEILQITDAAGQAISLDGNYILYKITDCYNNEYLAASSPNKSECVHAYIEDSKVYIDVENYKLQQGKLFIQICIRTPDSHYSDGYLDTWFEKQALDMTMSNSKSSNKIVTLAASIKLPTILPVDQVRPDWDENDPENSAYIRNRTHYTIPGEYNNIFEGDVENQEAESYRIDSNYSFTPLYSGYTPTQEDVGKQFKVSIIDKDGNKLCDGANGAIVIKSCPKKNDGESLIIESKMDNISTSPNEPYYYDVYRDVVINEEVLLGATVQVSAYDSENDEVLTRTFTLTQENYGNEGTDGTTYIWSHHVDQEDDYFEIYIDQDEFNFYARYNIKNNFNEINDVFYIEPGVYTINLSNGIVCDSGREWLDGRIVDIYPGINLQDPLGAQIQLLKYENDEVITKTYTLNKDNRAYSIDDLYENPGQYIWFSGEAGIIVTDIEIIEDGEELFGALCFEVSPGEPYETDKLYVFQNFDYVPDYTITVSQDVVYEDQPVLECKGDVSQEQPTEDAIGFSAENQMFFVTKLDEYDPLEHQPFSVDITEVVRDEFVKRLDEKYLPDTDKYQGDWSENDENSNNYIKNRTHWKEIGIQPGYHFETGHADRQEVIPFMDRKFDFYDNIVLTEEAVLNQTVHLTYNGQNIDCILDAAHRTTNPAEADPGDYIWYIMQQDGTYGFGFQRMVEGNPFMIIWMDTVNPYLELPANTVFISTLDEVDGFKYSFDTASTEGEIYHKIDNDYQQGYYPKQNLFGYGFVDDLKTEPASCKFALEGRDVEMTARYSSQLLDKSVLIGKSFTMNVSAEGQQETNTIEITEENIDDCVTAIYDGYYVNSGLGSTIALIVVATETVIRNISQIDNPFITNLIIQNDYKPGTYYIDNMAAAATMMDADNTFANLPVTLSNEFDVTKSINIGIPVDVTTKGFYDAEVYNTDAFIGTAIEYEISGIEGGQTGTVDITDENLPNLLINLPIQDMPEGSKMWMIGLGETGMFCGAINQVALDYIESSPDIDVQLKAMIGIYFPNGAGTYIFNSVKMSLVINMSVTHDKSLFVEYKKISDAFLPDGIVTHDEIDGFISDTTSNLETLNEEIKNVGEYTTKAINEFDSDVADELINSNGTKTVQLTDAASILVRSYGEYNFASAGLETENDVKFFTISSTNHVNLVTIPKATISNSSTYTSNEAFVVDSTKITTIRGIVLTKDNTLWIYGAGTHLLRLQNATTSDFTDVEYIDLGGTQNYQQFSSESKDRYIACGYDSWTIQFMNYDGTIMTQAVGRAHFVLSANNRYFFTCQRYGIVPGMNQDWTEHIYTVLCDHMITGGGDWTSAWAYRDANNQPQICQTHLYYNDNLGIYTALSEIYANFIWSADGVNWNVNTDIDKYMRDLNLHEYLNIYQYYKTALRLDWADDSHTDIKWYENNYRYTIAGTYSSDKTICEYLYNGDSYGIYFDSPNIKAANINGIVELYDTLDKFIFLKDGVYKYTKEIGDYSNDMYIKYTSSVTSYKLANKQETFSLDSGFWPGQLKDRVTNSIYTTDDSKKIIQLYENTEESDGMHNTNYYINTGESFSYASDYEIPVEYTKEEYYATGSFEATDEEIDEICSM